MPIAGLPGRPSNMSNWRAWIARILDSFRAWREADTSGVRPRGPAVPVEVAVAGGSRTPKTSVQSTVPAPARGSAHGAPGLVNLDGARHLHTALDPVERDLIDRIAARIDHGHFELPHLPATSLALVNMAGRSDVEVARLVELVSSDPSLASELLRMANSVLYATHIPAETLDAAVMRIGLRGLRSLVFSVSVKSTVLRLGRLEAYSEEVWRQAFSVANIARAIAPLLGVERERAFLLGLLHDVGKIALLAMLNKELHGKETVSPAIVGRIFYVHHERAGALLCQKWRLDEEIASVAGNHHRFATNLEHGRVAALASLAHKLDLHLSFGDHGAYRAVLGCEEMEFLELPGSRREAVLVQARRAYEDGERDRERGAA